MTPFERLMQEAIPQRPAAPDKPAPWTPEEQAQHRADLAAALDGWEWDREQRRTQRRHLRLVDNDAA
ncbi:hypothetical protein [Streptomyces turgidiscabies]|uniref:hypothetical protein n=1 Tax=Streptomyces turgidiscabies TaxID=85558 RepID=UPI0038F81688